MTTMRGHKSRQTLLLSSIDDHQEQGDVVVVDDAGWQWSRFVAATDVVVVVVAAAAVVVEAAGGGAGILFCPWFIIYRRQRRRQAGKIVDDSNYMSPWFKVHPRPFIVHLSLGKSAGLGLLEIIVHRGRISRHNIEYWLGRTLDGQTNSVNSSVRRQPVRLRWLGTAFDGQTDKSKRTEFVFPPLNLSRNCARSIT